MKYRKFAIFISIILFSLGLIAMEDKSPGLLKERCRLFGAYRQKEGKEFHPIIKGHCKRNRELIKQFVSVGPKKRVLILGPGPSNDLPIKWFMKNFQHLVFIDGHIDPIREKVDDIIRHKPGFESKQPILEFHEMDLSGGYYRILSERREDLVSAFAKDLAQHLRLARLGAYEELLKESHLKLDLAQFNPDVVISSLVTSQLDQLVVEQQAVIYKEASKLVINSDIEFDPFACYRNRNFYVLDPLRQITTKYLQTAYLSAIRETGAKLIYYADTQDQYDDAEKRAFNEFKSSLSPDYIITSFAVDAWPYDEMLTVSHYEFLHHSVPHCTVCKKYKGPFMRCAICKKGRYCGVECQRKDWPTHQKNCAG